MKSMPNDDDASSILRDYVEKFPLAKILNRQTDRQTDRFTVYIEHTSTVPLFIWEPKSQKIINKKIINQN